MVVKVQRSVSARLKNMRSNGGYDVDDDGYRIKSVQKKFRDSFSAPSLDTDKWDYGVGVGGTLTQSAGVLQMGSGVSINSETYIQTKEVFTIPFRVSIGVNLSQRIANQSFFVEAISVDKDTLQPDGKHAVAMLFDGTTATSAKYRVQNGALTPLDASATFPTSASGSIYELELFADEAWFHGGTLDSTSARTNSYRRHQQIPEPNAIFKVRLRWLNAGTAPATSTNASVNFLAVQDYAELTAEITAGRGQTVAGQSLGVSVVSIPTTNVVQMASATSGATAWYQMSSATLNPAVVKSSAGQMYAITVSNSGATPVFVKLYNKTTNPVQASDTPIMNIMVPAGATIQQNFPIGIKFTTGIAIATTGAMAHTDATLIAANQATISIAYA